MIKLDSLRIREFRGIRDLTLTFNRRNHAVCGPNGTGKSGVVDAIEFALTGDISRLGGAGRSDLSVRAHAPHINVKDAPEKAVVSLTVFVPSLDQTLTITRNVKEPRKPKLDPDTAATRSILAALEAHKEVVLSRREIIRYVVVTPGERAKEVQILLRLDDVEKVRARLEKIANAEEAAAQTLAGSVMSAGQELARVAGIAEARAELLLAAVNQRRKAAGVPEFATLDPLVPLNDGLAAPGSTVTPIGVSKVQANADLKDFDTALTRLATWPSNDAGKSVASLLDELAADEALLKDAEKASFYDVGLELTTGDVCPFCDKTWDLAELRQHVQQKIERLKAATGKRRSIQKQIVPLIELLEQARTITIEIGKTGKLLKPPIELQPLRDCVKQIESIRDRCRSLLPIANTRAALRDLASLPAGVKTTVEAVTSAVAALPDPSVVDAARDYLLACQQKLESLRLVRQKAQQGKLRFTLADAARTAYAAASKKVLEGVYDAVRDEFVRLYRLINQEDEGTFSASLEPSAAKLSFGVDFYGKGQHPPGAYHSEGHQDGMGLCLYLALMKYLFKNQFALAVLDDVVMSVDTGHRKHVCTVLQTEFRDTQFILTTHDRVWLAHMKSEGLIKQEGGATHFKTWNVETGPRRWDDRDTFTRIREELAGGNVREAAGILRPDLEYVAAELCEGLRAEVVYVQDGRHDLGMLLNPAAGRFKKLLNRALASAESWNKEDLAKVIRQRKADFEIAYSKTKAEEWQTNALIHFNTWQNLEAKEFKSVADAFEALLKTFQCQDCNSLLFVTHQGFDEQDLRCNCGRITWNLVRKPAEGAR